MLIIDHHVQSREVLRSYFEHAGCEVVATANDPAYAMVLVQSLEVDVIILDAESPRMNAFEFLEQLMIERPTPVIMSASSTEAAARLAIRGLELGAVDIVEKPALEPRRRSGHPGGDLLAKAAAAAATRPRLPDVAGARSPMETTVIAIGGSTGGSEALAAVLADLPRETPGIAIVQHLPACVMNSFAERLDRETELCVRVANDGDRLKPGVALLAPGDKQMRVVRAGHRYRIRLSDESSLHTRGSSIDTLFESVAAASGKQAFGILLAGNGTDGVHGLVTMHRAGAMTVAQDSGSSVADELAAAAVARGAVRQVLAPDAIAARLLELAR